DLASLVARLGQRFEPGVGGDWAYDHANPRERSQLRGIVGFRFHAGRIELKFKLNQNHPPANVQGAIDGLRAQPGEAAAEVAALMASRLSGRRTCADSTRAVMGSFGDNAARSEDLDDLRSRNHAWSERVRAEDPECFSRLSKQQAPECLWIGCSDSRVPANQIIDMA